EGDRGGQGVGGEGGRAAGGAGQEHSDPEAGDREAVFDAGGGRVFDHGAGDGGDGTDRAGEGEGAGGSGDGGVWDGQEDGGDGDGGAAGGGGDGDAGGQHEDDDRADHADCDGGAAAVRDPRRRLHGRRGGSDEDSQVIAD